MSKLKTTQFAKGRNKSRMQNPYDIDAFRQLDEIERDLLSPNTNLPPVGAYVTPYHHENAPVVKEIDKSDVDEQTFEMKTHENKFCSAIRDLWKQGKMCDVMLSVDKTIFRAHKIALAACSEHFRDLFVSRERSAAPMDTSRIPLLGIRSEIVKKILDAIYTSRITLNMNTVGDILSAAAYLRMPSVVDACQLYLSQRLSIENCLKTMQIAHMYNLDSLKERCYEIACRNFKTICKHKDFTKLRYYEIAAILPRQDIVLDSEIQVFNAIIRWTEDDRSNRITYIARLMRHVRFPLMTENQLVDQVEGSSYVKDNSEIGELVREAVRYHLLPYRRSILQTSRTIPRTSFSVDVIVATGGLPNREEGPTSRHVYYYVPGENTWTPLTLMPEARHHHAVTVLGGFLYVAGGDTGQGQTNSSNKVWRYDPWSEEWLQIASMLKARQSFQLGVLDSKLYAVGGRATKDETLADVERYNPSTNTWSAVEPISSPRRYVAVATLSGRLYAVGGSGSDLISRRVERFNPVSSQWERRHPICKPRFSGSLHVAKNRLWLLGGATVHETDPAKGIVGTKEIEVYSPAMDQWSIVGHNITQRIKGESSLTVFCEDTQHIDNSNTDRYRLELKLSRTEAGSCILDDQAYLVTGYSWKEKGRLNNVECIDLSSLPYHLTKYSTHVLMSQGANFSQRGETQGNRDDHESRRKESSEKNLPNYPLRCTGMACAALKLYKEPNFKSTSGDSGPTLLPILGIQTAHQETGRISPRLAFGEAPKTAFGRFHYRENSTSNAHHRQSATKQDRDTDVERGIETLRSIGFPPTKSPSLARTKTPTPHSCFNSPQSRGGDNFPAVDIRPLSLFPEDDRTEQHPPELEDEFDVALDKVVSLTLENWDDLSGRQSNSPMESRARSISSNQEPANTNVFMTE